ncbi:MAG: hypothetical protein E6I91_03305 [Chloroflexi bacterium]|nr:MAG: hypothetical protein E6I91_03305 [Chloroflexota bacterium]
MTNLTAGVLLFPLLGFVILGLTGSALPRRVILAVAWGACGLAFLLAAISFFSMLGTPEAARTSDQVLYTWVVSGDFQLSFGLLFDPLSATMLMIVTGVGLLIHIYSAGYMEDDPGFWRFFCYMNFFIFAMVLLVSADNFLFLLVGWGLVGLASFLLIGFWYQRRTAVAAAQKALVINIIGDFGLMIAIFLIFKQYGVLNFYNNANGPGVFSALNPATTGQRLQLVIALCLFVACAAKSAQLPLYMWLPDAMEGPTPVSALIYSAGIFHLTTHAYFKALLFLGAGAVIHALGGEQDMREMGGLRGRLRTTFWTFLVGTLAISGIPPLAGFWSKDEILSSLLAQATANHKAISYLLWGIGIITVGLTAFYMFRLFYGIFMGDYRGSASHAGDDEDEEPSHRIAGRFTIHEAPAIMTIPLIILAVLSIIGGLVGSFDLISLSKWRPLTAFLSPVFADVHTMATASLGVEWISTLVSVVIALLGIFAAWRLYGRGFQYKENKNPLYQLVFHKYYVDEILDAGVVQPILWFGRTAARLLEGDVLDGGSRAVAEGLQGISAGLRRLQTGYVRNYALAILVGVVLIILYYAVRG